MRLLSIPVIAVCSFLLGSCAVSLQPKEGAETLIQAQGQMEAQNYERARQLYRQSLEGSGDSVIRSASLYGLSLVAREEKHYGEHVSYLEQAADLRPDDYKEALAKAYWRYGNAQQKALAEDTFKTLEDYSGTIDRYLAQISYEDEKPDRARTYYGSGVRLVKERQRRTGDPDGKLALELGRLHYLYEGVEKDCAAAAKHYTAAIEKGQVAAAYELATLWQDCEGYKRPAEDVFALMLQAAEREHGGAMRYVAAAYMDGNGVSADTDKALEWYKKLGPEAGRKAAEKIADSLMFAGGASKGKAQQAVAYYAAAAVKGSTRGAVIAAAYGRAVPSSFSDEELMKEAERLERRYGATHGPLIWRIYGTLAERKIPAAIFRKARAYELGEYTEKDLEQSKLWYEKAAEAGSPEAYLYSARLYMIEGDGPETLRKAFEDYRKAAKLGNVEGQYHTGLMYARGMGTEKDAGKAREWLQKAEKNGYVLATKTLDALLKDQE
ncbi:MAG: tetratricopeptide repeat protein [Alphaproteobacteria bacterium]